MCATLSDPTRGLLLGTYATITCVLHGKRRGALRRDLQGFLKLPRRGLRSTCAVRGLLCVFLGRRKPINCERALRLNSTPTWSLCRGKTPLWSGGICSVGMIDQQLCSNRKPGSLMYLILLLPYLNFLDPKPKDLMLCFFYQSVTSTVYAPPFLAIRQSFQSTVAGSCSHARRVTACCSSLEFQRY